MVAPISCFQCFPKSTAVEKYVDRLIGWRGNPGEGGSSGGAVEAAAAESQVGGGLDDESGVRMSFGGGGESQVRMSFDSDGPPSLIGGGGKRGR